MNTELPETKYLIAGGLALLVIFAGGLALTAQNPGQQIDSNLTDWENAELQDVSSGETFSVSQFDKPVLIEGFAVWCSTCTKQQQEIKKLHEDIGDEVVSISINTDPNEDEQKIQQHIDRYDFDWRYAVAPPAMTQLMVNEFGREIVVPPRAPVVLVCENGDSRKLPSNVKPASMLKEEINKGC